MPRENGAGEKGIRKKVPVILCTAFGSNGRDLEEKINILGPWTVPEILAVVHDQNMRKKTKIGKVNCLNRVHRCPGSQEQRVWYIGKAALFSTD